MKCLFEPCKAYMNWHGELCPVHIGIIRDPSVYFQWFNIQNDNIHTAPVDVGSQA